MKILVINAGSSSVKFTLFDMENSRVAAEGMVERIGLDNTKVHYQNHRGEKLARRIRIDDTGQAIGEITALLGHRDGGVIRSTKEITAVGHRVVHGGEEIQAPMFIDDKVKGVIKACFQLAPLHNLPNLDGICACEAHFPDAAQVAVFDTAFHTTIPEQAYLYGLPYRLYRRERIRRYGFHGTSHKYVSGKAAQMMGTPIDQLKMVTCHLGNGSGITAVDGGRSVDTSMGMTPLEGSIMGTRCGDIDPAIAFYLMKNKGLGPDRTYDLLNKESGLLGLAEIGSSDFRDIVAAMEKGNRRAKTAIRVYAYRVKKYIGAYAFAMGGLDAIIFTAGVGENSSLLRRMVCAGLEGLGIVLDPEKNAAGSGRCCEIQGAASRVKILVVPTEEEMEIARQTLGVITRRAECDPARR